MCASASRPNPYDLVFAHPEFENEAFPAIREEADVRGVDVRDKTQFIMLTTVGELVRSLLPGDASGSAVTQFGAIVMQAYHYWLADKPTFEIAESRLRELLDPNTVIG